ncbi:MAG: transposase [Deltaproteobacteria bacterium]|nr:transposase [Deltaproteobacteria bacterium]
MTMPRSSLVSLSDTPWYHVVCRCVRRAFLCGEDSVTGQSFEHRRGWIETRIRKLASVFAIDVAAYAVMSNHYHLVVRIDEERTRGWSDEEVLKRWTQLFNGPLYVQRYLSDARSEMSDSELDRVGQWVELYRQRLCDLSWMMRVLNESIARMANAEDHCTGRFWEGRFKSQALLDEQALLSAMAYVDLNPVRAGIAETPEESSHTSVKQRVVDLTNRSVVKKSCVSGRKVSDINGLGQYHASTSDRGALQNLRIESVLNKLTEAPLLPFEPTCSLATGIPFSFDDYLELVDCVGRVVHPHKSGYVLEKIPAILTRLGIDADLICVEYLQHELCLWVGMWL